MTHERLRQMEELYHSAREREPGQRAAFLAEACQGDEELRREVESLLAADERPLREAAELSESQPTQTEHQLTPGVELGPYVIEGHLGAGGMGEVYRAKDKRLRRTVALKVLPPQLSRTPGLRQRLEREAQAISALNHPHICTLYDIGRQGEIDYLVMEFLEGETLRQRLKRGALSLGELLEFSIQIADALSAAHSKGITHRDIKPANVFVTGKSHIKVLDFGLAKLRQPGRGPGSETATMPEDLTTAGVVMGTAAYMSPEQARGEEVDPRTDLFSFGVMLYEMATGSAPFQEKSATDTLAAILRATPAAPRQLRPDLPITLEQIINTALEKDRELRYQTAAEMKAALMRLRRDAESPTIVAAEATPASPIMTRRTAIGALVGAAVGAAGVGLFGVSRWRGATPRNLTRFAITIPDSDVFVPSFNKRIAISPDGIRIAFNTNVPGADAFYLRSLNELESKRVKDVPSGGAAFFSPDGHWIGFFITNTSNGMMRKLALSGGAPVTVCAVDAFSGATWAEDDTIYWVEQNPGGVMSVPAAGGQPREVLKVDFAQGERQHKYPCALPGGKAVLATVTTADIATFDEARIALFSPQTGQRKVLVEGGTHPRFSPSGHLLYAHDGKILAVRFDPKRLEVQGQPFTVLEGVLMSRNTGVANFDVSASGDLAYIPGICDGGARTLVWVDRSGKAERVPLAAKSFLHPRLSPDDSRLAIEVEGPSHDLYVYDFDRGVLANITTDGVSHWPVWSPDGTQLGYRSGPMGHFTLWRVPADRSRAPQQLPATGVAQSAESWSPDGRAMAYTAASPGVPPSIMVARLDGDHQAESISQEKAPEGSPKFSPDGRWLAYCSNESGKPQMYVQAFPGPGAKIQISNDGGTDPVWKRKGGELYYRNGDNMMAVAVSTAPTFTAGRPQELWKGHYSHGMSSSCGPPGATSSNYDVTADGKRFLMIKDDDQDSATSRQIVVVLGWADEITRMEKSKNSQS